MDTQKELLDRINDNLPPIHDIRDFKTCYRNGHIELVFELPFEVINLDDLNNLQNEFRSDNLLIDTQADSLEIVLDFKINEEAK